MRLFLFILASKKKWEWNFILEQVFRLEFIDFCVDFGGQTLYRADYCGLISIKQELSDADWAQTGSFGRLDTAKNVASLVRHKKKQDLMRVRLNLWDCYSVAKTVAQLQLFFFNITHIHERITAVCIINERQVQHTPSHRKKTIDPSRDKWSLWTGRARWKAEISIAFYFNADERLLFRNFVHNSLLSRVARVMIIFSTGEKEKRPRRERNSPCFLSENWIVKAALCSTH